MTASIYPSIRRSRNVSAQLGRQGSSLPILLRLKSDQLTEEMPDESSFLVKGPEKGVHQQAKLYTSRRLIKSVSKGADDVEDGFECENIESYQDGNQEKAGMEVMEIKHEKELMILIRLR
ncbi:hypothetical protein V6N13_061540 [Hibiscus sabdariffa]|uniref:Uncharacterized protein n=2 Tax=Hibiscus sabdariffa TaxID=183260 RepID=A0ABR1ZZE7_9ROSI